MQHIGTARACLSLDDHNCCRVAQTVPAGFVESLPDVVTLDETQRAPGPLPAIKLALNRGRHPGRFLLTGSSNLPLAPQATESLAVRMAIVRLHPLTGARKDWREGRFVGVLAHV